MKATANMKVANVTLQKSKEVACGFFLVQFLSAPNVGNFQGMEGNKFLTYFWGGLMIGRLMGAVSMGKMASPGTELAAISLGTFFFIYLITSLQTDGGKYHWDFLPFGEVVLYMAMLGPNFAVFVLGKGSPARLVTVFALVVIALLAVTV